jgi:hypothetical protein
VRVEDDGEVHQLASAMLVLAFTAVMLVVGLLYIERSATPLDRTLHSNDIVGLANESVGLARAQK